MVFFHTTPPSPQCMCVSHHFYFSPPGSHHCHSPLTPTTFTNCSLPRPTTLLPFCLLPFCLCFFFYFPPFPPTSFFPPKTCKFFFPKMQREGLGTKEMELTTTDTIFFSLRYLHALNISII